MAQPMRHGLLVVVVRELGVLVAVVVSGTVPAGAGVGGDGPNGDVVDVSGA